MTQGSTSQAQEAASHRGPDRQSASSQEVARKYLRFLAMITTSTVIMYLLTYTNVFDAAHIRFSEERVYMALLMGSMMAIVMLGFMWSMHPNRRANVAIIVGALVVGTVSFYLSQSQVLVDDRSYMRAMIPHHSIAILTSERAAIRDLRVRELADEIIAAQFREIGEMDWLIEDIGANGLATTGAEAEARPVPSFGAAP